jgi:heterodisulfide reductase subunit C
MAVLKQAMDADNSKHRSSRLFYEVFLQSVQWHGRANETELMAFYFARMKSLRLPLHYMPLGLKLLSRGKMSLSRPWAGKGNMKALFDSVDLMENGR